MDAENVKLTTRMHSKGKGISSSALPFRRSQPSWSKATPEEVSDQIFKFAKRGLSPSQIGVILRDSHGIPQVKFVTGNKILRILKTNGGFSSLSWASYKKGMGDETG
jgi:small subunit ribosomal protein S13e